MCSMFFKMTYHEVFATASSDYTFAWALAKFKLILVQH